jgi:hypothetical protein
MHIDPIRDILAIHTRHIILTFISNSMEPVLTRNSPHPTEPIATSEPSSTQLDPDDDLNLLYLTPPPSPVSLPNDQYEGMEHGPGMFNEPL